MLLIILTYIIKYLKININHIIDSNHIIIKMNNNNIDLYLIIVKKNINNIDLFHIIIKNK